MNVNIVLMISFLQKNTTSDYTFSRDRFTLDKRMDQMVCVNEYASSVGKSPERNGKYALLIELK